jgi:hypothetical protein
MGGNGNSFPEDFVFRQNDFRSEDLEVEERAILSLCYQELDHVRVLAKLGVNSELYRYKMDQYKELSTMRTEIEKVLQEQRLEKIRRDFEKAKYEDERRYNHDRWLEEQKREILAAKLRNQATNGGQTRGMTRAYSQPELQNNNHPKSANAITAYPQPQTSRYENPGTRKSNGPTFMNSNRLTQNDNHRNDYATAPRTSRHMDPPESVYSQGPRTSRHMNAPDLADFQPPGTEMNNMMNTIVPDTSNPGMHKSYDPKNGLGVHFDFLTSLERKHRDIRLVYGVFNNTNVIITNREAGIQQSEPDPAEMSRNRVNFLKKHMLKGIKPHAGSNLIMEFQVKRNDTEAGETRYASIGWTVMNLFDSNYELNTGQFRCPLYHTPTKPDLDIRDIPNLKIMDKVMFCFRIAVPKDSIAQQKVLPDTHPGNYSIPRIHSEIIGKETKMVNNSEDLVSMLDSKNSRGRTEESKSMQEAYECSGINVFVHYIKNYDPVGLLRVRCSLYEGPKLVRDNKNSPCQWSSRIVHPDEAIIANQGNMEKLMKMGVYIYSETVYGKKDVVVPINDDQSWLRDFYSML